MSTSAGYSDIGALLDTYSQNFVALRYSYEAYEGLSEDEYARLGAEWLARGAQEAEARFVYHPEELYGLSFAIEQRISKWLHKE